MDGLLSFWRCCYFASKFIQGDSGTLTRRINKARTPNNDRIIAYLFFLKKYRQVAGVPPKVSRRLRHPKETHRCTSCLHSLAIENCQALYVSCVSRHHKRNEGTLKKKNQTKSTKIPFWSEVKSRYKLSIVASCFSLGLLLFALSNGGWLKKFSEIELGVLFFILKCYCVDTVKGEEKRDKPPAQ